MLKWCKCMLAALSALFFLGGLLFSVTPLLAAAVTLMSLFNLLYAGFRFQKRMVLFFFQAAASVFFVARPFIALCVGNYTSPYGESADRFAFTAIFISFAALSAGEWASERFFEHRDEKRSASKRPYADLTQRQIELVRRLALSLFVLSLLATALVEGDKLLQMAGKSYLRYYTDYVSRVTYPIAVVSGFLRPSLCFYLATLPKKRPCFAVLSLFVLSAAPMLFIGQRNLIVQYAVFSFLYYLLRDRMQGPEESKKWFGRGEKIALGICAPVALVSLSIISVSRFLESTEDIRPLSSVVRLFYDQGVTFDVLRIGYAALPSLLAGGFRGYTVGAVTDYFAHGTLAQRLFGASDLGAGNNAVKGMESHSLAHNLSYQALGEDYLHGRGLGSSYLLETYADFGYFGIVLYSLLLGALFYLLVRWLQKRNSLLLSSLSLCSLVTLFFTPRAEAVGFISFLFTPYFWLTALLCLLPGLLRSRLHRKAGGASQ